MSRFLVRAAAFVVATIVSGVVSAALSTEREPGRAALSAQSLELAAGGQGPIVLAERQSDLDLSMVISPGQAGANDLNFYMIDVDRDWKDVERFAVRFAHLDGDGVLELELTQLHEGHFPLEQLELRYAGRWRAEVTVLRSEAREELFSFEFALPHR